MKNRSKSLGKHSVPTDEPFVDYENLVTGAKFNYDRPQAVLLFLSRLMHKSMSFALMRN